VRFARLWAERGAPLLWFLAGGVLGWSLTLMVFWSMPARLGAAAIIGVAAVLARGLARLTVLVLVALGLVGVVVALGTWLRHADRPPALLLLAFGGVTIVLSLLATRVWVRHRWDRRTGFSPLLDLAASAVVLVWSLWFYHRVSAVGLDSALHFFFGAEDNAAWISALSTTSSNGPIRVDPTVVDTFGPVVVVVLAAVRLAVGVAGLGVPGPAADGLALMATFAWLVALAPLVSLVLVSRVLRSGRFLRGLLAWFVTAAVLAAQALVLVTYGFMSGVLAAMLLVVAVSLLADIRPSVQGWWRLSAWGGVALVVFAAGASWFPIVPLGGVGVAVWTVAAVTPAVFRSQPPAWIQAALASAAGLLIAELLYQQIHAALTCCGGADPLIAADGAVPETAGAVVGLALALIALGWLAVPSGERHYQPALLGTLLVILGYVVVLAALEASRTTGGPHYGGKKLLYIVVGTWIVVAVIDILVSQARAGRPLYMSLALGLAVLASVSVQGGPVFAAVQSHWPAPPLAVPAWATAVRDSVSPGDRVACLSTEAPAPGSDPASLDAYRCSRWAQSVAGAESADALAWRFALLGRMPISAAVPFAQKVDGQPLKVLVIGSMEGIHDPAKWWAPLVPEQGVDLIPAG
jgi:hypothetical protein